MTDPFALELRRLTAMVEALCADVRHVERRQLRADDRRVGLVLLRLAYGVTRGARFTGPALLEAAYNDRSAEGRALCEVLVEYGNLRALGKLLARLAGVELGGHRLVRIGPRGGDALYVVESVCDD